MLKQRRPSINNEKGMAIFEMIPIMVIIVLFVNFSLGFFGAIHTGIINSIAARNYTFETFRNRSDLTYFRNLDADTKYEYSKMKHRVHGTVSEKGTNGDQWIAASRVIDFMDFQPKRAAERTGDKSAHGVVSWEVKDGERFGKQGVNPIWIKSNYGICLNATCGS
ncbi:hypothetical protein D3C87_112020 [compost metagenome]